MVSRFEILLSWLALPVYVWQGLGVRRRSLRMPPPPAPVSSQTKGKGKPLRLLVIGDSSAAGVGVDTFKKSLAGRLQHWLALKSGRPVHLRNSGNNSATSSQIRDYVVPHLEREDFDYISLNIGTNESKNFHTGRRFRRDFGTLIYVLKNRFPGATIIWSGVIDMAEVPALPFPLNKILGIRSRVILKNGRILCHERGALAPKSNWQPVPENFSKDGFHASEKGYDEWAEELAEFIIELEKTGGPRPKT